MKLQYAFAAAVLLMLLNSVTAHAQGFRLNAYSGYTFDDRVNSYYNSNDYYEGTIKGGYRWGLGAEYMLSDDFGVEFSYLRQDTKAPISYYNILERHNTFDFAANWIFVGGTHYRKISETVEPYGGLMAGAALLDVYNPDNKQGGSVTKFSWGARLGTNLFFPKRWALNFRPIYCRRFSLLAAAFISEQVAQERLSTLTLQWCSFIWAAAWYFAYVLDFIVIFLSQSLK